MLKRVFLLFTGWVSEKRNNYKVPTIERCNSIRISEHVLTWILEYAKTWQEMEYLLYLSVHFHVHNIIRFCVPAKRNSLSNLDESQKKRIEKQENKTEMTFAL